MAAAAHGPGPRSHAERAWPTIVFYKKILTPCTPQHTTTRLTDQRKSRVPPQHRVTGA